MTTRSSISVKIPNLFIRILYFEQLLLCEKLLGFFIYVSFHVVRFLETFREPRTGIGRNLCISRCSARIILIWEKMMMNFSVGYQICRDTKWIETIIKHANRIHEVFFSLVGVPNGRTGVPLPETSTGSRSVIS